MATTVVRGGTTISTKKFGGRIYTTRTPAPSLSIGKKRSSTYEKIKKEQGEKEAEIFAKSTLQTITKSKPSTKDYSKSRGASREYRQKFYGGASSTSLAPQSFVTTIYKTKSGDKTFSRVINPTEFTRKYIREQDDINNLRTEIRQKSLKKYAGTSSMKYGYVNEMGEQIATSKDINIFQEQQKGLSGAIFRSDKISSPPSMFESFAYSEVPTSFYGTSSKDYGRVNIKGDVVATIRPTFVRSSDSIGGIKSMNLPVSTWDEQRRKGIDPIISFGGVLQTDEYFARQSDFSKDIRSSVQRQKRWEKEINILETSNKQTFPMFLSKKGKKGFSNIEKAYQLGIGAFKGSEKFFYERPGEVALTAVTGGVMGAGFLGSAITNFLSNRLVSSMALGIYTGSVAYNIGKARTPSKKGEILGTELTRTGAFISGYGLGNNLKLSSKELRYSTNKGVKYAPKIKGEYAPKIKGEITTPADRTPKFTSRFTGERFTPSIRETSTRFSPQRFKPKIDYYSASLAPYSTGKTIMQSSKFTKQGIEESFYRPDYFGESKFTIPEKLSLEKIKRANIPSGWDRELGVRGLSYNERITRGLRTSASDWAFDIKPTKTSGKVYRIKGYDKAFDVKPSKIVKVDTRKLGAQPINYRDTGQQTILRLNPQKEIYTGTMYGQDYDYYYGNKFKNIFGGQDVVITTGETELINIPNVGNNRLGLDKIGIGINVLNVGERFRAREKERYKVGVLYGGKLGETFKLKESTGLKESVSLKSSLNVSQIPQTRIKQSSKQKTSNLLDMTSLTVQDTITTPKIVTSTRPRSTFKDIITRPKNDTPVELPLFSLKRRGFRGKYGKVKGFNMPKMSFGYSPSVEASAFNIKGVIPKGYKSGLILRPLIK